MTNQIATKTAREKLAPRREPYFVRLRTGLYVGFRKLSEGEGTWIARRRSDGKQRYFALGPLPDFDSAAAACLEWSAGAGNGTDYSVIGSITLTVAQACALYTEHQRLHKGETAARHSIGRFKRLVDNRAIGALLLSELRSVHIHSWIAAQVIGKAEGEPLRKAKDTANRNLSGLKAALNFAYRNELCTSDAAWRSVKPFEGVGRRRQGFVCAADRERLLQCSPTDFRAFVTALLLTAARPGEIAAVRACDLDTAQGTVQLTGKTGFRVVPLSTAALAFFRGRAQDKIGNALLFTNTTGAKWNKDCWGGAFERAARAAGLSGFVLYSIRHTSISEMIAGGMDSFIVARMAGTSTEMIDKHYGHLRVDRTRDMLDRIQLLAAQS